MAYFRIEYFSEALQRDTTFELLLPNDPHWGMPLNERTERALFLLHGYKGKASNWAPEELAYRYNFAIVMPSAENSFYLNGLSTGHAYQTMLGEELVDYVRRTFGLALRREDTAIAGLSMGGYGALHTGLAYPETFGKIAALSSALIVHGIAHMKPGEGNSVANYAYYHECFGDLETVEERETNPEVQIERLKAEGKRIPEINMYCGTEDFLLEPNRQMHAFLDAQQIPHYYKEAPGAHTMDFWSKYIAEAVERMFAK
ncbi:MAG: esterase family protein [Clostridia bacterium]|nr:esterase family protein [Clostridia bacterium]